MLRFLRRLFLLALLLSGILAAGIWWVFNSPVGLRTSPLDFTVAPAVHCGRRRSRSLMRGLVAADSTDRAWTRILGVDAQIKAGSYEIRTGITPLELLRKLTRGDVTQAEILFVEGWTFRQLREKLDAHPDVRHELRGLPEAELLKRIGANEALAEGLFFPDTYLFAKNSSDTEIMARAYRAMKRHIDREWQQRASNLPYRTPYEALVMASIVEKETGRAADRPMIASVFVNRLRVNMLLQTDPTVIYGLGDRFDGNIRKRDLLTDTPHNTYTRPGLPPGPIANPGLASLRAALNPASSDALYFVARGDGTSQFSRTLEEHNQAVVRYQLKGGKR